jgi:hypothetical protein
MTLLEWWGTDAEGSTVAPGGSDPAPGGQQVVISNTIELWVAQTGILLILIRLLLPLDFNWALAGL